ncbi:hypothetical protein D3C87_1527740 [compost metagenome]
MIQRHHRHERRAGGNALPDLDAALGDHTAHRRRNPRAGQRHAGVAQLHRGGQHVRVGFDRGAVDQRVVALELLGRDIQRGARGAHRLLRVDQFLARDRAYLRQRRPARRVFLRARQIHLAQLHIGAVLPGHRELAAHLPHTARQLRAGGIQRQLSVHAVHLHQDGARLDHVGIVGADRRHHAAHLRRHLHHIALHVGVLGGHPAAVGVFGIGARQHRHGQHGRAADGGLARQAAARAGIGGR